jgi:hypothetical protein
LNEITHEPGFEVAYTVCHTARCTEDSSFELRPPKLRSFRDSEPDNDKAQRPLGSLIDRRVNFFIEG